MGNNSQSERASTHGFVLLGDRAVLGGHLAMFNMPAHRYQVIAPFDLGEAVRAQYVQAQQNNPTHTYVVVNTTEALLQDLIGRGQFEANIIEVIDNDLEHAQPITGKFVAKIKTPLHNRPFDPSEQYPPKPRYLVFGAGGRAHITHYMTKEKDYQLLADLTVVPPGLSAQQLATGVLVDLDQVPENHEPATDPLEPYRNQQVDAVINGTTKVSLTIGTTRWFDTKELNMSPHAGDFLGKVLATAAVG